MSPPKLRARWPCYVAGKPIDTPDTLAVTDKYTGKRATEVSLASPAMIETAIAAAVSARDSLRRTPPWQRQAILDHCVTRLRERSDELAVALCIEAGKPIRDSRGEVTRLIDTFRVAAEESVRIDGEALNLEISQRTTGYRGFTKRVPIGPCAFITPFNFPLNLVAHKVAPAIASGCPFIVKPSDRTPVGALILGEVLAETDLPAGAFSVLPCKLADIDPLISDERIKLLSFTGSGAVGWPLKTRAGRKKVLLELGGNAACIVDGDQGDRLDAVVDRLLFGAYYQSGQSCISVQRIIAHADLYDALRERLVAKVQALRAGDPRDEATTLGPMIDEAAALRLEGWIFHAVEHGAKLLTGGTREGAMLAASLLEDVGRDEPLRNDEAFGPVAILSRFTDFDAALREAGDTEYGLQVGVFTHRLDRALRAWDEMEVGGVIVGDVPSFRVDTMPYGGVRASGLGREGVRYAIDEMTELRLLVVRDQLG